MRQVSGRFTVVALSPLILGAFVVAAFGSVAARDTDLGVTNTTVPVSGMLQDESGDVGTFLGRISHVVTSGADGSRSVSGVLRGRAVIDGQMIRVTDQAFTSPVTMPGVKSASVGKDVTRGRADEGSPVRRGAGSYAFSMQTASDPGKCDVLYLDIQPITLNLLGLEAETSAITVDINAIPGEENILGNLVCPAGAADGSPAAVATEGAATATISAAAAGTPATTASPTAEPTTVVEDLVGTEEPNTDGPTPTT